jgi:tight adherence protein B
MTLGIIIISIIIGVLFIGGALLFSSLANKKKSDAAKNLILDRNASAALRVESENQDDQTNKSTKREDPKSKNIAKRLKQAAKAGTVDGLSKTSVRYLLIQLGSETTPVTFWIWSIVSCIGMIGFSYLIGASTIVKILLAFTGLFGLPRFILKWRVHRRQNKFLEEFPDCLDGMMRLLKSGMPITEAIAMTSREYTGPIGEEMSKVYEAQRVGDTLPQAVQKLAIRVPLPEIQMFATAVIIQTQTGSSLSEVLGNLSGVIRQRFRLRRKVEALSAEAKISAMIIGALPCVVVGALYLLNREYISLLWTTPTGKMLSYGAITWMSIGILVMRQMINFKA